MRCPLCGYSDTVVKSSRPSDDSTVRRRRFCTACHSRFTTVERVSLRELVVLKKNGRCEPFDQEKIMRSIKMAFHKRPLDSVKLDRMITSLIRQLETSGDTEIPSSIIGEKVLECLAALDPIAYVRFASLCRNFQDFQDFSDFLMTAKENRDADEEGLS